MGWEKKKINGLYNHMGQWSYTEKTAVKPGVNLHRGNFMESGKALFPMSWEKRGEGPKRSPVHNQFPHERGKREQIPRPEDSHRRPQWLLGYTTAPKHLWTISPNTRVPSWTGYRNKKPCPASEDKQNCQNDSFESPLWKAQIWAVVHPSLGGVDKTTFPFRVSGILSWVQGKTTKTVVSNLYMDSIPNYGDSTKPKLDWLQFSGSFPGARDGVFWELNFELWPIHRLTSSILSWLPLSTRGDHFVHPFIFIIIGRTYNQAGNGKTVKRYGITKRWKIFSQRNKRK